MKSILDKIIGKSVSSGDDWETLCSKCRDSIADRKRPVSDDEILTKVVRYFPESGKIYEQSYREEIERRKIEVQQSSSGNGGYHKGDKEYAPKTPKIYTIRPRSFSSRRSGKSSNE